MKKTVRRIDVGKFRVKNRNNVRGYKLITFKRLIENYALDLRVRWYSSKSLLLRQHFLIDPPCLRNYSSRRRRWVPLVPWS